MGHEHLSVDVRGHVAVLTLSRPERLNAMHSALQGELLAALAELRADDAVRALVVTGAGRGFCSGADVLARDPSAAAPVPRQASQAEMLDDVGWVGRQALALYGFDKPVIAAVNGVAAGAGMSLALACDVRVGSERARFKTVFIERNLSPDSGMSFFLPRIVGYSRAADLVYTSRAVDADEAYRIGLLDRLVPHATLLDAALELAASMTQWPPVALRASKRVLQHNVEAGLEDALRFEMASLGLGRRATNDARESRLAFVEKRKPTYTGT
jgi:2-(1,2-epoxy-1,2-dihydrophenyl)acetyl-CoA isomerase